MQRRTFLLRAAALAAVALPLNLLEACSGSSSPGSPTAQSQSAPTSGGALKQFKYGDLKSLGDLGIYVAAEEGYFAEQGLEVAITSFDSAANMVAPLGAGQLDAAGGAL